MRHAFALISLAAASLAGRGTLPAADAPKPQPYVADDSGIAYVNSFRLTFEAFQTSQIPVTCGWFGENKYRSLQAPAAAEKDRAMGFLGGRSGSNSTLRFERETVCYDANGDGKYSGRGELYNRNKDTSWGPIQVRIKHAMPDASEVPYAVFLWKRYSNDEIEQDPNYRVPPKVYLKDFAVARGGVMKGKVLNWNIELCDDNTNGRYSDIGADSISVDGKGMPLAATISLDGVLYFVKVAPSGSVLLLGDAPGPFGFVKPYENCQLPPGLEFGGIFLTGAAATYEVARPRAKDGTVGIPPGEYVVSEAFLAGKGTILRMCSTGELKVAVEEGKTAAVPKWGPPLKLVALAEASPLGIEVSDFKMVGQGGESYSILDGEVTVTVSAGASRLLDRAVPRNDRGHLTRVRCEVQRAGTYSVAVAFQSAALRGLRSETYSVEYKGANQ